MGGPDSPEKGLPSNIDPDPLYITKLPWWAIIDTPAKRHFNGVSLMGRWWPIFSGISVLSHYPLRQNVLDPRMHAVHVTRLDGNTTVDGHNFMIFWYKDSDEPAQ